MTETQPAEVGGNPADRIYEGVGRLAAALAAVQLELPQIRKAETGKVSGVNKEGKAFSYEYSYADLAAVSAAIMPLLGKNGLAFTSWPTATPRGLALRYFLIHESGEQLEGEYPLPSGATAQQLGSAITYARRYCLCAVTGVAPDNDDDAAAADGRRQDQRAEQQAEQHAESDRERHAALDAVKGAWFNQYGEWNGTAASDMFAKWSQGGDVAQATPQQLRAFAGYLHTLPAADAGSTPNTEPEQPADDVKVLDDGKPLGRKDNAHMFVLFEKLGMKDDPAAQREYLGKTLERDIESRRDVRAAEWPKLRDALEYDVRLVEQSGMVPNQPSEA